MIRLLIIVNVFFVSFADKPAKVTPALSPRAIEQRQKWQIDIDELDYPVHTAYLDSLHKYGATIHHTSRWMNGATCTMTDELAELVAKWPFVTGVECTRDESAPIYAPKRAPSSTASPLDAPPTTKVTDLQLALYDLLNLHDMGYRGQGIVMTICDGGFTKANTLSCFRQEQELGHFDFTDDADPFYGTTGRHGTQCLSTISGSMDNYTGAATEADYYLMRSEESGSESPKEMDNLVAALEKADSLGTNVFSVSLGYAYFDHLDWSLDYSMLDGKTLRVSRAATIAARKGMLVCVAAGNAGNKDWHWISAPADADSILTVGAVDVYGQIGAFSSFGPSADGRIKPDVCAVGVSTALITPEEQVSHNNGTSFATPLIAGLAATLWSALPDENAMQIRERIIRSADRYTHPDANQYGYGIPDALAAYFGQTDATIAPTASTRARKYIQGNELLIECNGRRYNVMGAPR